uniref:Uncharacterized protein n=1 Tax=Populus alba TaxID=43335 RepID=A0A4U5P4T4_POPAL|nr:uncharacterized protein D5086_0000229980 [Populus alba]
MERDGAAAVQPLLGSSVVGRDYRCWLGRSRKEKDGAERKETRSRRGETSWVLVGSVGSVGMEMASGRRGRGWSVAVGKPAGEEEEGKNSGGGRPDNKSLEEDKMLESCSFGGSGEEAFVPSKTEKLNPIQCEEGSSRGQTREDLKQIPGASAKVFFS